MDAETMKTGMDLHLVQRTILHGIDVEIVDGCYGN